MSKSNKKQDTKEVLDALSFFKDTATAGGLVRKLIKTGMPENFAEKFMLTFLVSFSLFNKNHATLMKHGEKLKDLTNKYAEETLPSEAPFIVNELNQRLGKKD